MKNESSSIEGQEHIQPDKRTSDAASMFAEKQLELQIAMLNGTEEMVTAAQKTLKKLPQGFEDGLNQVAKMFYVQFSLGIVLLLSSIVLNFFGYDIITYIFGAAGGLVLITTFITSSPTRLQKNRVDLAQWGIAYFNWFNTLLAINQTVTTSLQAGTLTWETFKESQMLLLEITERTLWDIEDLCEFSKKISKNENTQEKKGYNVAVQSDTPQSE